MQNTLFFCSAFLKLVTVFANSYSVTIVTDRHVNLIDKRFLSFTVDPKYLFSKNKKYGSKECICMASSLSPAFIRIAGPSTALMSFHNSSISIQPSSAPAQEGTRRRLQALFRDNLERMGQAMRREDRFKREPVRLEVSHSEWRQFVRWAKTTGFDLVFALNNHDKMTGGDDKMAAMWDPNMALNILTVAEKADVGDIYWQLGYECANQSIEEYLNDLETLRVITETFPEGRRGGWKVVGGDVTNCLQTPSDFKDYVKLSSDMMDAVMLDGNSSTTELARMSERDRTKLLRLLSTSSTPLWLTEQPWSDVEETSRAADWLTSLGHAARNGFEVHYRELDEEELYQPSLSFYMALLFKNLVGEKVLQVDMEPDQAVMFAHCTALRHKEVPGAVTLYGVNVDAEPARFSVRLGRGEGGDVMQFILSRNKNGNIIVNGKPMYNEGDLKPVVKRVRPYNTLLINLPANSFGFWVLANTKLPACFNDKHNHTEVLDEVVSLSKEQDEEIFPKNKRSVNINEFNDAGEFVVELCDCNDVAEEYTNEDFKNSIENINKDLIGDKYTHELRSKRQTSDTPKSRVRQIFRKLNNKNTKSEPEQKPRNLMGLLKKARHNISNLLKRHKTDNVRPIKNKNKITKRQSDIKNKKQLIKLKQSKSENNLMTNLARHQPFHQQLRKSVNNKWNSFTTKNIKSKSLNENNIIKDKDIETKPRIIHDKIISEKTVAEDSKSKERTRRSIKDENDFSEENEIDYGNDDDIIEDEKLWKLLKQIHKQINDISEENIDYVDDLEKDSFKKSRTKDEVSDEVQEDLNVDTSVKGDQNFIKSTLFSLLRVISDLNNNLNKFWNGITLID